MSWHRRRQIITLLFGAGIALLIALAGVSVYLDNQAVKRSAELSQIRDHTDAAQRVLVALVDIETGVRGYLITGESSYLAPLFRGRDQITNLRAVMGPEIDPWSAPGYSELTLAQLMTRRQNLIDSLLETARVKGFNMAREELRLGESKFLMDRMRAVLTYKINMFEEEADRTQRSADYYAELHSFLVVASLGIAILFSIAQFFLFRSEVSGRGAVEQVLRRRNEDRHQVTEMSTALQLADSRHEAYAIIASFARRMMTEVSGVLYVYTASRDQLTRVAQWSRKGEAHTFAEQLHPQECWGLRQGSRHDGCAGESGAATDAAPITCRHLDGEDELGPYACIPIVGRGQILGMLHLRGEILRRRKTAAVLDDTIERLTDQLSLSLTNIELREKLENMALRDGLTGLYNRRFLDETLERDLSKLQRDRKSGAVLLLDVDHFKRFNDTHGHQAGDEALRRVGTALLASVRQSDVVCRYGGEEFLVFLPDCNTAQATAKAEKIRAAVPGTSMTMGERVIPSVTISIGLAMFPAHAQTRALLLQMADRALYQAKAAGRNRVVVAGPEPTPAPVAAPAEAAK
ncbi:diguanylate cyclase [Dongia sp.]|uniref:sensor domain-containing diguanylate cyclase n=1 Tax=Dongia sp. TaxID=1977262 RepID=UPI003750A3ED